MLSVHALSCGTLEFDRSLFFPAAAPGTAMLAPVSSFLIVHPRGKLLFDTGIHREARARSGESRAFTLLMRRHKDRVYRFIRAYGADADEAYDLTQETFTAAWSALGGEASAWEVATAWDTAFG